MAEYTLENPIVELNFNQRPSKKLIVGFMAASIVGGIAAAYLFIVLLPAWFGFNTAVLTMLFLIMISVQ